VLAAARSRGLLSILCAMSVAWSAGANDLEALAQAVEAVAEAARSSEGFEGSRILGRIDPEQLELLRKTFGADAATAVGDLRVQSVGALGTRVAPRDDVLADILRAEPGLARLGSIGLARALRQTRQFYTGRGNPVPDAVKVVLSITFAREILDGVRVVDTDSEASLPAIINQVQTQFGDAVGGQSAVTVVDVIAFSQIPEPSAVDFWAHELQHVVQYRKLGGIDAFAAAYTRDYHKLEGDANAVARKAVIDAENVLTVIHALNRNGP
jgi:hypothetical protein